jgi:CDP-diacylglycerol---serine O-phosphatidyltransferase
MNRIRYLIPNLFTAASLTCGLFSLHFIIEENFVVSAWLIAASMFFDGIDGKIARILSANTKFGALFDTLSDFVAFGIVPAFLAYKSGLYKLGWTGVLSCFVYVFCGGYRLVRYMLNSNEKPVKGSFSGLPIPAAAGLLASFVILNYQFWYEINLTEIFLLIVLVVSILMVSKIEYFALEKGKKLTKKAKGFIILASISLPLSIWFSYLLFVGWILLYIMYGLIRQILKTRKEK